MTKHIFVTGGVVSSLGKGLTSASIGMLLEQRGLRVRMQKLDPYINVDPGTMSPYQHGEVYVLDDGSETDLDLGHYERFTHSPLTRDSNYTTGQIYQSVINKERRGEFLGKTVQVIPHITNEIKACIRKLADDDVDVVITEIGGTVGDIESQPFLEAIRQFSLDVGKRNCLYIHLTLVPYLKAAGELKTKPTQHSVGQLRQIGIQPDILICRTERSLSREDREKIALFCNVPIEAVIEEKDKDFSIYEVPLSLVENRLDELIVEHAEPAGRHARSWTTGASCCTTCAIPSTKSASPWSASTPSIATPTSRSTKRSTMPASPIGPRFASSAIQSEVDRAGRARAAAVGLRRAAGARRIWRTGHRRQGRGDSLCPRARDSVLRHLPGHAVRGDRIRPQRRRTGRRPLDRVQQGHAASGDLPARRAEDDHRQGGHDAAGRTAGPS